MTWIILICNLAANSGPNAGTCTSVTAVNGTEMQCRAMMMAQTGRVSCVAPDGTVIARLPQEVRR